VTSAAVVVAVVTLVVVLVVRSRSGTAAGPAPHVPVYDPPVRFDPAQVVNLPREADGDPPPVALAGFDAFVALPGRLQVIDTRTGQVRAEATPTGGTAAGTTPRAPVLGVLGGRNVVVVTFVVTVPGHGTTVSHDAAELVVLDRDTLARLPGARLDLPPTLGDAGRIRAAWTIGESFDVADVVIEVGPDRQPATYAVEVPSGAVRWRAPGLRAVVVEHSLVIGAQDVASGSQQVRAVAAGDGHPVWTAGSASGTVTVVRGGRAFVAALSVDVGAGQRALTFYDTSTGRAQAHKTVPGGVTCRFDERMTTVCWSADAAEPWAAGFDATSARTLWELPDAAAGRVAPKITTVWHGVVYGTTGNGPVVLDAATGADRTGPSPNIAPDLVDGFVGLVGTSVDRPRPKVYRAVG
jgi:hypothetical protein